jgi:hypothetical protein
MLLSLLFFSALLMTRIKIGKADQSREVYSGAYLQKVLQLINPNIEITAIPTEDQSLLLWYL